MKKSIFITGTDTNTGKTFISCLLLKEFNALKLKTFAIKPVASGCQKDEGDILKNDDALHLQYHASIKKPYHVVNPIALQEPIAPHIAANKRNIELSKTYVNKMILSSMQKEADINLIEGVGGWSVPLNDSELFSDIIAELHIPVILVVGIKLGCLNHTLLTYQSILAKNVPFVGWIANCLSPSTLSSTENIQTLKNWIKAPCLGVIPFNCQALGYIDIQLIQKSLTLTS